MTASTSPSRSTSGDGAPVELHTPPELHREVAAIGGRYELTGEHRLSVGDRPVLYATGVAEIDATCCGVGGCTYAVVAGYVVEEDHGPDGAGRPRARVERIRDPLAQRTVREAIERREHVSQVVFR